MKDHKRALIFLIGVLGFLAAPLSALAQSPAKQPAPPTLKSATHRPLTVTCRPCLGGSSPTRATVTNMRLL